MKLGFYLDNRGVENTDFSKPWEGNPGTGAAEYLHVALPYFIAKYGNLSSTPIIFATHIKHLPKGLVSHQVASINEAAIIAKDIGINYFVFRPRIHEENNILDLLDELQLSSIGRASLTPHSKHVRRMAKSSAFKALVCVGREQFDYLMDSPLQRKLAYIDNGVNVESCAGKIAPKKDPHLVAYMGALVPQKGFHVLAEAWPQVLKTIPTAQLSVIGSVKMYNEKSILGPLGVAEYEYESEQIIPYLTDKNGKLLSSVTFHGRMGKEKYDILRLATVGIANPTGQTETCCVSAVEIAACRTAVVSGAYYALLDTVHHKKTGLLGRNVKDLAENIIHLLKNQELAADFGRAGYQRTLVKYDFSVVAPMWIDLGRNLDHGLIPKPKGKLNNIFRHFKILRISNRLLQRFFGKFMMWPSVQELEEFARRMLRK